MISEVQAGADIQRCCFSSTKMLMFCEWILILQTQDGHQL